MPQDYHTRERPSRSHTAVTKDRSDIPKRKSREVSEDTLPPPAKKKHLNNYHNSDYYERNEELDNYGQSSNTYTTTGKGKPSRPPPKEHKYPSVNELKKRTRDARRLLDRVDLPADARVVQERALAGYEKDLEDELRRRKRSDMIKKYHFVRFLERKTASKHLKRLLRLEKQILDSKNSHAEKKDDNDNDDNLKHLSRQIESARIDLNYTIYFPLTEKYISLYPNKKLMKTTATEDSQHQHEDDDAAAARGPSSEPEPERELKEAKGQIEETSLKHHSTDNAEKPTMWHIVQKCTKKGQETLDLLRDGKLKTLEGNTGTDMNGIDERGPASSKESKKKGDSSVHVGSGSNNNNNSSSSKNRAARRRDDVHNMGATNHRDRNKDVKYRVGDGGHRGDDDEGESDGGFFE